MRLFRNLFRKADIEGFRAAIAQLGVTHADVPLLADEFAVSAGDADRLFLENRRPRFIEHMESAYRENRFDAAALTDWAKSIGLTEGDTALYIASFRRTKIETLTAEILADGEIDPAEDARLSALLRQLGNVELDEQSQTTISDARTLYHALRADLPIVNPPVLLKRGEVCHHVEKCEATEHRQRTTRVNYAGPVANIHIANGLSYRVGSLSVSRSVEDYEQSFGSGALCLTNKRLLWIGQQKTLSILIPSIVHYESFLDAITVRKGTGKPVTFYWGHPNRTATAMAVRVIVECR